MIDANEFVMLEVNKEVTMFRAALTTNNLKQLAKSKTEIGIIVYKDVAKMMKGESAEENQYKPKPNTKPIFQIHTHPEHGGDQPSITDLNSAEIWQLYNNNPNVRFMIITVRGITEYRLPENITSTLLDDDEEFRQYYLTWLKKTFGADKPDGQTIATTFNNEHNTCTFHPWDTPGANKIVQDIQGL